MPGLPVRRVLLVWPGLLAHRDLPVKLDPSVRKGLLALPDLRVPKGLLA